MKHFSDLNWLWLNPHGDRAVRATIQLHSCEAALLWKYCKLTCGGVVEIGRRRGGSTVLLLEATEDVARTVTSVDRTSQFIGVDVDGNKDERCMRIFNQYKNRFNFITASSGRAVIDHDYDLLFIDGDHSYKGVKTDTETHWGKLEMGGIAVYHDYGIEFPGVTRHCNEWVRQGCMKKIEVVRSMAIFKKVSSEGSS